MTISRFSLTLLSTRNIVIFLIFPQSSEGLQNVTAALGRRRNSVAPVELVTLDMSDITRCLTTSIQPFTGQLQQLQQIYVNVHIFHLLFEKVCPFLGLFIF